jgi:hypothetical protein
MGPETLYVQLRFDTRVAGADDRGWVSVGLALDRETAYERAKTVYGELEHPVGGRPQEVRVVSENQIRGESGERGVLRAGAGIVAMALALRPAQAPDDG